MGFWSAISNGVSSLISGAISAIGTAVSSFVASVAPAISSVITAIETIAKSLREVVDNVLQHLGILMPNETTEDLGERALQAAEQGIKPEGFERFDEYMNALRNFEVNLDKAASRPSAEKLTAGIAIGTLGLEYRFNYERGALNTIWLLPIANPDYFTAGRIQNLISTGQFAGDVLAYLEKRLSGMDARRLEEVFECNLGENATEQDKEDLYKNLDRAQEAWRDLMTQIESKQD